MSNSPRDSSAEYADRVSTDLHSLLTETSYSIKKLDSDFKEFKENDSKLREKIEQNTEFYRVFDKRFSLFSQSVGQRLSAIEAKTRKNDEEIEQINLDVVNIRNLVKSLGDEVKELSSDKKGIINLIIQAIVLGVLALIGLKTF